MSPGSTPTLDTTTPSSSASQVTSYKLCMTGCRLYNCACDSHTQKLVIKDILRLKSQPKPNNSFMRMGHHFSSMKRRQCPPQQYTVTRRLWPVYKVQVCRVSSCGRSSVTLLFNCVCWYWYCRSVCIQSRGVQALLSIPSKLVD